MGTDHETPCPSHRRDLGGVLRRLLFQPGGARRIIGARFATYPVSLALVDANTNVLYEFLLINLANAPYQLVPAGSYFPAYRAWTNTAGGILTNTPWVVTNAITLSNFTSNVLTLITAATTTNDFCANAALTSITVTAP
jgi:hypothetical protein